MTRSSCARLSVLTVAAALAVAALGLAEAAPAGAVAHGEVVAEGSYRFAARLAMSVPFAGFRLTTVCSGALVAPEWIITAGHCFLDPQGHPVSGPVPYPTSATIGRADLTTKGRRQVVDVVEVRQAPGTDIALGRLAHPVGDVAPLVPATTAPTVGMTLRLTGWGATGSLIPLPSNKLRTGLVSVTSVSGTTVGVTGRSPARDTSACLFDSGAPYFTEGPEGPRLVAVENDGPACPHALEETTARVDTVVPWLRSVIGAGR